MSGEKIPGFICKRVIRGRYLFLDLDPPAETDLAVACAGWEDCAPGYEIIRDNFRYMALEYIVGGTWELETPNGKWVVGPGTVFTYGPGIAYSLKALSKSGLSKYFVDFTGRSAARLLAKAGLNGARPGRAVHGRWLHDLLDQLIETSRLRPGPRKVISNMLVVLLLERAGEDLRIEAHNSRAERTYEECRRYLTDNYLRIRSLSDAARTCGLSAVHMSRLFSRFAAESPHAFVSRMKMNHAAELITRASFSVKAAAAEVGFEDPYHFSRVFKRVHGVAPSLFGA
jgi:AraC-like DNA-binding protein